MFGKFLSKIRLKLHIKLKIVDFRVVTIMIEVVYKIAP